MREALVPAALGRGWPVALRAGRATGWWQDAAERLAGSDSKYEKGTDKVKIKIGSSAAAVVVALMLWLLASHSVDWLVSVGLPH